MVVARYQEIITQDLDANNRNNGLYRGLARCCVNWQRMKRFCQREGIHNEPFRKDAAIALILLLKTELCDIATKQRVTSLNCSQSELSEFIKELGINTVDQPTGWSAICLAGCKNSY
jgi:hypothetical protein